MKRRVFIIGCGLLLLALVLGYGIWSRFRTPQLTLAGGQVARAQSATPGTSLAATSDRVLLVPSQPQPVAVAASPNAIRLWAAPIVSAGQRLDPMSAAFFALQRRGLRPEGRRGTFDSRTAARLAGLQRGSPVVLPLVEGEDLPGAVNLVQTDENGMVRVGGSLTGTRAGTFSISESATDFGGVILLPAEKLAYYLSASPAGGVSIRELPLSDVICYPIPRDSAEPQLAPLDTPQAAPPLLSSRPTATAVLYLDFDGATVTDPLWNNGNTIVAAAPSLSFSSMSQIWERVKEDYWPFNIDVTTDASRYNAAPVGRRMRVIITPTDTAEPGSGGVAYVDSFSRAGTGPYRSDIPCWVFNTTVTGIAEAISHELGHTLGLSHDRDTNFAPGTSNYEYYSGHGSGSTSWGPIMGAAYTRTVVQWSKGQYPSASNFEDDVAIIAGAQPTPLTGAVNNVGYVADEAGGSRATAASLSLSGVNVDQGGTISTASDADFYTFTIAGPAILSLSAKPALFSPDLDILMELQDSNGNTLVSDNSDSALQASLSQTLNAGTYYIKIQGVGRSGNSSIGDYGYSNYGSIGSYSISGTLTLRPTITSQPVDQTVAVGNTATFTVSANGSPNLSYKWKRNGIDLIESARVVGTSSASLTLYNLSVNDAGTYTVYIQNSAGNVTSNGATLTVFGPTISSAPLSKNVTVGQAASFTVSATSGGGALTYQWKHNNQIIPGATSATLALSNIQLTDGGYYEVVVTADSASIGSILYLRVAPPHATVIAWGQNTFGQTTVPAGLGDVADVIAGSNTSFALTTAGTLMGWGQNSVGLTTIPSNLGGVISFAVSGARCLALKADGTVAAWGIVGGTDIPSSLNNVVAVAVGESHSVVLKTDGTLVTWGNSSSADEVVIPRSWNHIVAIACSRSSTMALKSDGTVLFCGSNTTGEFAVPAGLSGVAGIAAGWYHSLALKSDGTVVAWGLNDNGKATVPPGLSGVISVGVGYVDYSLALKSDGAVVGWGLTPTVPAGLSGVVQISAGNSHALALVPIAAASIITQPSPQSVAIGGTATFSVGATGATSYQWKKDGVALSNGGRISGATTATLTVANVQSGDAGNYAVVIGSAGGGSVTSADASLTVSLPAKPDFNGDGKADILWRNPTTGEVGAWLMNGTSVSSFVSFGGVGAPWQIVGQGDFNGDGKTDILWRNSTSGDVGTWLMNGTSVSSFVMIGSVGAPWQIAGAEDFNGDGKTDILWRNPTSGDVGTWLMNGTSVTSFVSIGSVGAPWQIVGVGDFNADSKADILWRNPTTGDVGTWLMNGTSVTSFVSIGSVGTPWQIMGVEDLNGDGKPDIVWRNTQTGAVGTWLMNGVSITTFAEIGSLGLEWASGVEWMGGLPSGTAPVITGLTSSQSIGIGQAVSLTVTYTASPAPTFVWRKDGGVISGATTATYAFTASATSGGAYTVELTNTAGTALSDSIALTLVSPSGDFDQNGSADVVWRDSTTGDVGLWLLNGTTVGSFLPIGSVGAPWQIVGVGDLNGDGKADILWRNPTTGDVGTWLMNGTSVSSFVMIGSVGSPWQIVGVGDFNGDGKADILWRNPTTGDVGTWLMNNTSVSSFASIGSVGSPWQIVGVGDLNGDGKADILWRNPATGDVGTWLMNGTSVTSFASIGSVGSPWQIADMGDYNRDGKTDILWRNSSTGEVGTWLMNGTSVDSFVFIGTRSTVWSIKN